MAEEARLTALAVVAEPQANIETLYGEYKKLLARAVEVFGSETEATRWLSSSNPDFVNRTPLQVLTAQGSAAPLEALGRIEHGVFF
jgi:uncharacterized protein (DUF2384 family)